MSENFTVENLVTLVMVLEESIEAHTGASKNRGPIGPEERHLRDCQFLRDRLAANISEAALIPYRNQLKEDAGRRLS